MKCATAVTVHEAEGNAFSILDVVPHESQEEAEAYVFSEILRVMEDIYEDKSIIVSAFRDEYGELCIGLSSRKNPKDDTYMIKTMFKREE